MQPNASSLEAVVAGTDFSEPSDTAMSWAMLIAREHRAVLHVVHAVARTLPLVDHFDPLSPVGKLAAQLGQEQLVRLEETLSSPDQPLVCHLSHERPSVAILKTSRRCRAGLIVTGTRGEGGLRHLLLGSTAERVAERSSCPVLVVPPASKPARNWPTRILVPTDFSIEADAALCAVESLICRVGVASEIILLTVFQTPTGLEQLEQATTLWRNYIAECSRLLRERIESLSASVDSAKISTQCLVREGIPAKEIVRVAADEEVDLIAVGSRGTFAAGKSFLGSVSKRVIQAASCPTLIVPSLLSKRMRSTARG